MVVAVVLSWDPEATAGRGPHGLGKLQAITTTPDRLHHFLAISRAYIS
jgi:hypothetical protein